jgi:hypothetical protein
MQDLKNKQTQPVKEVSVWNVKFQPKVVVLQSAKHA